MQQRRWGTIFDSMVREGLIEVTFGQRPEEDKEGETTNVNVVRQQQYWCVEEQHMGTLGLQSVFIHLNNLSVYLTHPIYKETFQTY